MQETKIVWERDWRCRCVVTEFIPQAYMQLCALALHAKLLKKQHSYIWWCSKLWFLFYFGLQGLNLSLKCLLLDLLLFFLFLLLFFLLLSLLSQLLCPEAMNSSNKCSLKSTHLLGHKETDLIHFLSVIVSCSLQYCAFLWHNCQYICPATGGRRKRFFHDREHSFCCWVGELGCMLTLIEGSLSEIH